MPSLTKAILQEIGTDENARPIGDPIQVQLNPTSLRMQMRNQTEGGRQRGRQARQYVGTSSTTLSFDLMFDTADERTSVLDRTSKVEYFINPKTQTGRNQAPPKVRFHWGQIIIDGVVESLNVDLDHFAHDGTPLRAKVSLSIKAQNPEYQFNEIGPGANEGGGESSSETQTAAQPGSRNNALSNNLNNQLNNPISNGLTNLNSALNNKVIKAFDNESLAQVAQRAGIDPNAWRALTDGISNPLSLTAGAEIKVGGKISASMGLGVKSGVQFGSLQDTSTKLGLASSTKVPEGRNDALKALTTGYALSKAGGVGNALETLKTENSDTATHATRLAFVGSSGAIKGLNVVRADERVLGYGFGIPLRDLVNIGKDERKSLLIGQAYVKSRLQSDMPPNTSDPTVPAWEALARR